MLIGLWRVTDWCGLTFNINYFFVFAAATYLSCRIAEGVTATVPTSRTQSVDKGNVPAARLTKSFGRFVRRESTPTTFAEDWPWGDGVDVWPRQDAAQEFDFNANRSKLFVIMTGDQPRCALMAQASWVKHLHWPDKMIFACGSHCRKDGRLESVVIVPKLMLFENETGMQSSDKKQAQMRGLWALKWAWHNLVKTGSHSQGKQLSEAHDFPVPVGGSGLPVDGYGMRLASEPFKWWIIGDDDTFFNLPVLNRVLDRYNWSEPLVLAQGGINGGPGVVMSLAAVRLFVTKVWPRFQSAWRNTKGDFFYDWSLIPYLEMLGAEIKSPPEFTQIQPDLSMLRSGRYKREFATWHHAWDHRISPDHYETYIYDS